MSNRPRILPPSDVKSNVERGNDETAKRLQRKRRFSVDLTPVSKAIKLSCPSFSSTSIASRQTIEMPVLKRSCVKSYNAGTSSIAASNIDKPAVRTPIIFYDERKSTDFDDSFFRSPATPDPALRRCRFQKPPIYKGRDGRFYIAFFTNKYVFSNHYLCPSGVTIDDIEFPSTEHYYMYKKALFHGDKLAARQILASEDPKYAKKITAKFEDFDIESWKRVQYKVMEKACMAKFRQNPDFRRELFRTCNAVLVEASPSDRRWGVGLNIDDPNVADDSQWRGSNLLGNLLMSVRTKLATEFEDEFAAEQHDARKELRRRAIPC